MSYLLPGTEFKEKNAPLFTIIYNVYKSLWSYVNILERGEEEGRHKLGLSYPFQYLK